MSLIDFGALRRAMSQPRARRLSDATDLVNRTLARHGLVPPSEGAASSAGSDESRDQDPGFGRKSGALPEFFAGGLSKGFPASMPNLEGLSAWAGGAEREPASGRLTYSCAAGAREYRLHLPQGHEGASKGLVMMLHGCTQTPEDFAAGTRMDAIADAHGLVVVYPAQSRGDNAQSCWNWFSPGDQARGRGEPAILAGLAQDLAREHGIPEGRSFVAGLSAGGAMAVILARTYPDVFAAAGVHSGLPYKAARNVPQAFAAMRGEQPHASRTAEATKAFGTRVAPMIVFQGDADATVHASNADRILRDLLDAVPGPQTQETAAETGGARKATKQTTFDAKGTVLAETWSVAGLGHAWSGGDRAGSYTDPAGPDASAEMIRFFLALDEKSV